MTARRERPLRRQRLLAPLLALILGISVAHAKDSEKEAETAFELGRTAMESKNFDIACEAFERSQSLDPATGTLLNLAACYEAQGKTGSAWRTYQRAAKQGRKDNRPQKVAFAEDNAKRIEASVNWLVVTWQAPVTLSDLQLDNQPFVPDVGLTKVAVDPGDHQLQASLQGQKAWSHQFTVEGSARTIEVSVSQVDGHSPSSPKQPQKDAVRPTAKASSSFSIGYLALGAGAFLVGSGVYSGIKASNSWDLRNEHCPDGRCDTEAVTHAEDTNRYANYANGGVGLGALVMALGVAILVTEASSSETPTRPAKTWPLAPTIHPHSAGASWQASF